MREKGKLPQQDFQKSILLNVKLNYLGSFKPYIVNTNYQKVQKLTLLHEEILGKKIKKSKIAEKFAGSTKFRSLTKFRRGCKNSQPLQNWQGCYYIFFFCFCLFLASESLNCYCALHALSLIPTFEIYSLKSLPQTLIINLARYLMCQLGRLGQLLHKKCSKHRVLKV